MRLLIAILMTMMTAFLQAQHPVTFFTKTEAAEVKKNLHRYSLLTQSYNEIKKEVDQWIGKEVMFHFPKILQAVTRMINTRLIIH